MTSEDSAALAPGRLLEAVVAFPAAGGCNVTLCVVHAETDAVGHSWLTTLGVQIEGVSRDLRTAIGRHLLAHHASATPADLREAGLRSGSVATAIDFSCTAADDRAFAGVLDLRYAAYGGAGKLPEAATAQDTADAYDERAVIIVGKHHEKVVASMRLVLLGGDQPSEHEAQARFPESFPPRSEMVEITRVCTDHDYRRSDLLLALLQYASVQIGACRRRYVLGSATPALLPFYQRLGFEATGVHIDLKALAGARHEVILLDTRRLLPATEGRRSAPASA